QHRLEKRLSMWKDTFAVRGVPKKIKTDNGPAYVSCRIKQFFECWGIDHVTGIPHSPTGQAMTERANGT
ncbi:POK18 protein, partial [Chloroceryle aenea]|nr:POK18 protein [Chloroceryle aenea]